MDNSSSGGIVFQITLLAILLISLNAQIRQKENNQQKEIHMNIHKRCTNEVDFHPDTS